MEIQLDRQSAVPLFQQIKTHIASLIQGGTLAPATRLPATRQLARLLGVSRITVSNAYEDLEAAGLISAQVGRGTYVNPVGTSLLPSTTDNSERSLALWQQALAARPFAATDRRWQQLLLRSQQPGVISFAAGGPDPQTFPVDDFRKAMQTVFKRDGPAAVDYGELQGYAPLRTAIANFVREQGIAVTADEVLVASGSQQALSLVAMALLQPGDKVVVESPTYTNALQLFKWLGVQILGVPVDEDGMQVELLEHLLIQHRPQLIYTIPTFQNPTGVTLSGRRRRTLVDLATQYGIPIVEDDYVGGLRYDSPRTPWLKTIDQAGTVIHLSTFSKMLMPGPRVGFVLTQGPLLERLVALKGQTDLGTSGLNQRALEVYISEGRWRTHTRRVRRIYHQRRDAMIAALEQHFPSQVRWITPRGGFFVWVQLPAGVSVSDLFLAAVEAGVAFAPGPLFFPDQPAYPAFRLSFSQTPAERICQGIEKLGAILQTALDREPVDEREAAARIDTL